MAFSFKGWIIQQFSEDFIRRDTHKDADGKGFFERYTNIIDSELDDNIYPFIKNLSNLLDPNQIPITLLSHLAFTLGKIPQTGMEEYDRRLVSWANRLYQVKGTTKCIEMLCHLLNMELVSVDQHFQNQERTIYDRDPTLVIYDGVDEQQANYDSDCAKCTEYDVTVYLRGQDEELMDSLLKPLICFMEPIDAKLGEIIYTDEFALISEESPFDETDPDYTPLIAEESTPSDETRLISEG